MSPHTLKVQRLKPIFASFLMSRMTLCPVGRDLAPEQRLLRAKGQEQRCKGCPEHQVQGAVSGVQGHHEAEGRKGACQEDWAREVQAGGLIVPSTASTYPGLCCDRRPRQQMPTCQKGGFPALFVVGQAALSKFEALLVYVV